MNNKVKKNTYFVVKRVVKLDENIRVNQWGKSVEQKNKINTTLSPLSLRDEGPISLLLLLQHYIQQKTKKKVQGK